MNILTNNHSEILDEINEKISNIFIDEAHHVEADAWKTAAMLLINTKFYNLQQHHLEMTENV